MTSRTLGSLYRMDVISSDAFKIGEIEDIRYDPSTWKVQSMKVRTEKGVAKELSVGSGRSMVSVEPGDYTINDVMLMPYALKDMESVISVDKESAPALSFFERKKVVSKENVVIGIVENVNVDVDMWAVLSISVKLDKGAFEPLGLKKGLLSKTVIVVRTEYIQAASEIIMLNQSVNDMRDEIVVE